MLMTDSTPSGQMSPARLNEEKLLSLKLGLQSFQSKRIRDTYADIAQIPQYERLGHFFFNQLYGPQDFGFRNNSVKRLHRVLGGFVHAHVIDAMGKVIDMHDISDELDNLMVQVMADHDIGPELKMPQYQEAYRLCGQRDKRLYQIDILVECVQAMHYYSQLRFIGFTLKAMQAASHLAGMGKIMDFIIDGYESFHAAQDIDYFANEIYKRETALSNTWFDPKVVENKNLQETE